MKRFFSIICLLVSIFGCSSLAIAQSAPKKQVAVYVTDSDLDDGWKKVLSTQMVAQITKSPDFRALERTSDFLKALRSAQDYDMSGEVKDSQIAKIGQKLGVKYVAVIDASEMQDYLYVSARLISVESGTIIATSEEYEGNVTMPNVVKLAQRVAQALTSQSANSFSSNGMPSNSINGGQVETFTANGVPFEMVKVEGSSGTYYIGKTEVTQRLWYAVMGSNPSKFRGENLPVEMVSWFDCQEFVERLSRLTGRMFRLPTEAEWENAARGGNRSRGYTYSGSNDIYRVAWYTENSGGTTHPVAQKMDNELGIYDMSGNVWEWCSDYYNDTSNRVNRGGSWNNTASNCRVANRNYNSPGNRYNNLGLRLAL